MTTWKKGDTAVCISNDMFKMYGLSKLPQTNIGYKVRKFDGTYLWFEGFSDDDAFHSKYFRKQKTLNTILAEEMMNNIVSERSDYERIFSLDEDF